MKGSIMCGIIGILGEENVQYSLSIALQTIQHRGQDSCGMGTKTGKKFYLEKDDGLVKDVFNEKKLREFEGELGIGHVRYPTMGSGGKVNAQPFLANQPGMFMAHNGNIINYYQLRKELLQKSLYLTSSCDIEPVLYILAEELLKIKKKNFKTKDLIKALKKTYKRVRGTYTIVGNLYLDGEETMFACRDPHGIRPGVWGEKNGKFMVASESVALETLGYNFKGDIPHGEVMIFKKDKKPDRYKIEVKEHTPCIFEYIYFARPDSKISGKTPYNVRLELGRKLAKKVKKKNIDFDVVIPVPDTARPAATAIADELGIPVREGFIKNRYSARTFIMNSQKDREFAMRLKHNIIEEEFKNKNVLIIDDSIVRGTTTKYIVKLVKKAKPKKLHIGIFSPPVNHPCFYGIDISREEELIARKFKKDYDRGLDKLENKIAEYSEADSLTYLAINDLEGVLDYDYCSACFDGKYPLPLKEEEVKSIEMDRDETHG